ncbi:glycosyltransferase family 61 protein [Nocardioides rubriscoriae]|uniref:glycosyltransferase family 61 protein n=1 Tax=Nocardioides rubriscoriae TaxID=642762 RepID=UPI0014798257|nr:glycosyltransferase 61 family protein [Nocardioides rubriscoriae]
MGQGLGISLVAPATVSGYEQGDTNAEHPPHKWMRGAVHTQDGELVRESQRTWSAANSNAAIATDPERVTVGARATRLAGHWVYAGHWSNHFGHFLVEVLPTLWLPRPGDLQGLVAHRSFRGPHPLPHPRGSAKPADLHTWQSGLLALAGYDELPVMVVRGRPVTVERLTVPERPVVFRSRIRQEAAALWRRMAVAAGEPSAPGGRIFLSRRSFNRTKAGRSSASWDRRLDEEFHLRGYQVVEPETLSVREQVRLVSGAAVVAGSAGSALHLAAFCAPGTLVVEIGDARNPDSMQTSQSTLHQACDLRSRFVGYQDVAALSRALAATA